MSDPIAQLRMSMDRLDGVSDPEESEASSLIYMTAQAIKDFKFGPEKEDYSVMDQSIPLDPSLIHVDEDTVMQKLKYRSNLRMMPPPVFSRQGIPQMYK